MSVEEDFTEDNFVRHTSRAVTARVLAHLLAPRIADLLGTPHVRPQLVALESQGWSNYTLAASCAGSTKEYIVRLTERTPASLTTPCRSAPHFEKEHAILSRLQGLPFVPSLLEGGIGTLQIDIPGSSEKSFAFMVQERMPYRAARDCTSRDRARSLEQLGEICRYIHAQSCEGFGLDFDPTQSSFSHRSFQDFIESKIANIREAPISYPFKRWLEARAEDLLALDPEPKLFHRDLLGNPGNYLLDNDLNVRGIIDWEFAGSGPAFHYEMASMIYVLTRDGHPTEQIEHDLAAVLRGYGMPLAHYRDLYEREVETLVLMNSLSAIMRFAELEKQGTSSREPWRKVFAERANRMCLRSFAQDATIPRTH
ncbi:MAG: Phosphotransferase enzyme family [Pseudomonadota bacterium]